MRIIRYNYDDGRANGIYIPKFRNVNERHPNFIRGYGMQGGVAARDASDYVEADPGLWFGVQEEGAGNRRSGAVLAWRRGARCLPRKENRVTINKDVKDAWGIPAAHIDCSHGDNEKAMARGYVGNA